jgi:hypothetical protein
LAANQSSLAISLRSVLMLKKFQIWPANSPNRCPTNLTIESHGNIESGITISHKFCHLLRVSIELSDFPSSQRLPFTFEMVSIKPNTVISQAGLFPQILLEVVF